MASITTNHLNAQNWENLLNSKAKKEYTHYCVLKSQCKELLRMNEWLEFIKFFKPYFDIFIFSSDY